MTVQPEVLQRKAKLLRDKAYLQENLPHLYGWKFYPWMRDFFESTNRDNFIVAGNQLGKSSIQIRKAIHWATEPTLWPKLWRYKPTQFWYLYPTQDVATIEFEEKWVKEIMPKGEFKDHPQYGWRAVYRQSKIFSIHFNTGVSLYFKSYSQRTSDLQSGTVYSIFTDEELPEEHLSELQSRVRATAGYFHMVFTATLGQDIFRRTMEEKGKDELFQGAFKRCVSMYDCQEYEDGTPSPWTTERIQLEEQRCATPNEVKKRIHGKFVVTDNLAYPSFNILRNVKVHHPLPKTWLIYAGVDVGGGGGGHPAAIVFISVSPEFDKARVFRCWKGEKGVLTSSLDILNKFKELRGNLHLAAAAYDTAGKDFYIVSSRCGEVFLPADKNAEYGCSLINTLFKNDLLSIYNHDDETNKLVKELMYHRLGGDKSKSHDDLIDALRFAVTLVPWDFSVIGVERKRDDEGKYIKQSTKDRMAQFQTPNEVLDIISEDIREANEYYDIE